MKQPPHSRRHRLRFESLERRALLHAGGTLSGFVYLDADGDGTRDAGETPLPGIVIEIENDDVMNADFSATTMTDDNGFYAFEELLPGTYRLRQRQSNAVIDGTESTAIAGAVADNDAFRNVVLPDDTELSDINFGERSLRAEYTNIRWFFSSATSVTHLLRETLATSEELAGNLALAATIRGDATDLPDIPVDDTNGDDGSTDDGNTDDGNTDDGSDDPSDDNGTGDDGSTNDDGGTDSGQNGPFAAVTTGAYDDSDVLGIRTDLEPGAPAILRTHVSTAVDYSAYSNPPTYGPHHGFLTSADGKSITPRPTGVYTTEQPDEDLIHNLEHGHVWVSYSPSLLSSADQSSLEQFIRDGGDDTGVILTPRAANDSAIALASWGRLLKLDTFDAAMIRQFIEANRGHAPEGFIPAGQKTDSDESLSDGLPH